MASQYPGGVHPFANAFPLLTGVEFSELVDSIETHGLKRKIIVTSDGTLVDGRNRWAALDAIGWEDWESVTETLPDGTTEEQVLELIVTENLHRRHLTASQKAMLGADLEQRFAACTRRGPRTAEDPPPPADRHESTAAARAAKATGASEAYVEKAKRVMRDAPELVPQIRSGNMTVNSAVNEVRERKAKERSKAPLLPTEAPTSLKSGKKLPVREQEKSIKSALSTLSGLCIAIGGVQGIDQTIPSELRSEWYSELGTHIRVLSDFRRKIKEGD